MVVRYHLGVAERGSVMLAVKDRAGNLLIDPQPRVTMKRGSAEVTLAGTFVVPRETTSVLLFLPFDLDGHVLADTEPAFTYSVE